MESWRASRVGGGSPDGADPGGHARKNNKLSAINPIQRETRTETGPR